MPHPTLHTASFYATEHWHGTRYRVSRSHPRGRSTQWETLPFLYPRRDLLVAYRGGEMGFDALAAEYLRGLDADYAEGGKLREWMEEVSAMENFTLLCFEREGQPCHRHALAGWLLGIEPSLIRGNLR